MTLEELYEDELAKRGIKVTERGRFEGDTIIGWSWDTTESDGFALDKLADAFLAAKERAQAVPSPSLPSEDK